MDLHSQEMPRRKKNNESMCPLPAWTFRFYVNENDFPYAEGEGYTSCGKWMRHLPTYHDLYPIKWLQFVLLLHENYCIFRI